jgi:predicted permease
MWANLLTRLKFAWARRRLDEEVRCEIDAHVALLVDRYKQSGMTLDEAHAAARRQIGNVALVREEIYHMNGITWLEGIAQDLRHGTRMLVKNPGFSLVAIASIAIGVGANAAMFSIADGLLLRPLQVPHTDEIVAVGAVAPRVNASFLVSNRLVSYADYVDLRDQAQSFAGLIAYRTLVTSFADRSDQPAESKLGLEVSGNFFDVLHLQPALGRFFLPEEDRVPGRDAVIVLAHETWAVRFGSDPGILGRHVRIGGVDFTIIGVAPASFGGMQLALPPTFYVPLATSPLLSGSPINTLERRDIRSVDVRGRLKPRVSLEQASQEASLIASRLEQTYPDTNRNYGLLVRTQFAARLEERGPAAPSAFMLLTLAFVVLLVACANVAGLLLSRAPVREREIALRLAIGGARFRVTRQLITESFLLAAAGGVLGLAIAYGGIRLFRLLPIVSDIGVRLTFNLDRRAIGIGLAMAAISALLSSLVPAWRATHTGDLSQTLRAGAGLQRRLSRLWGRNGLVAGQIALSLMLLTVTVFLWRAFQAELRDPGFRTTGILLSNFEPMLARYDATRTEGFYRLLKERARTLPGVTSVGRTSVMPLNQDYRDPLMIVPEGYQLPQGTESLTVLSSRIDEGYLDTMGIPVLEGRGIRSSDTADALRVALVNQTMARGYWPGQNPIGRRIRILNREGQPFVEIVGVTADNKYNWIGEAPTPWMYVAQLQDRGTRSTLLVASRGDAVALATPLREIIREIDSNMPISGMRTMEDFYHGNAVGIVTGLIGVVGSLGLLGVALAMVGLYGLVAYAVARRTREIGIRMAVGARSGAVTRMVLRHGFVLAAWGVLFGVIGCVGTQGLLRSVFPTTAGIDLEAYILVTPFLLAITLLAAYIPARRAARIDPLVALRQE